MNVLVIQNSENGRPGYLGDWLREHGAHLDVRRNDDLPSAGDVREADLFVVLGSSYGVHDDQPWIAPEGELVRAALADRTPMVGICFGAQLIAQTLGATVEAGRRYSAWLPNDDVADEVWRGPWLRWHGDRFSAPPGATVLARSGETVQAFQHERALGVQFHPEADPAILEGWVRSASPQALADVDVSALLAASRARFAEAAPARDRLFAEIVRRVTAIRA